MQLLSNDQSKKNESDAISNWIGKGNPSVELEIWPLYPGPYGTWALEQMALSGINSRFIHIHSRMKYASCEK